MSKGASCSACPQGTSCSATYPGLCGSTTLQLFIPPLFHFPFLLLLIIFINIVINVITIIITITTIVISNSIPLSMLSANYFPASGSALEDEAPSTTTRRPTTRRTTSTRKPSRRPTTRRPTTRRPTTRRTTRKPPVTAAGKVPTKENK